MSVPAKFPAIIACIALLSCSAPQSQNIYIKSSDVLPGSYDFSLDFSDSLSLYDVYFYTEPSEPIHLTVRWISPSDSVCLAESVWLRSTSRDSVKQLYRSGVKPDEIGVWRICVSLADMDRTAPDGIGIITEKTDGTRQTP